MNSTHSESAGMGRRSFLALAAAAPALAETQRDWTNGQPVRYPDPDVVTLDKRFAHHPAVPAASQGTRRATLAGP